MQSPKSSTPNTRVMRLALAASIVLVLAALAAFYFASKSARKTAPPTGDNTVTVTINGSTCEPADITVPAGRTVFTIVNKSQRAVEWEILDGVMVLEERENIAPGFSQTLTARLSPGTFEITCGLLSNPRGKLVVTPSAASAAEAARPSLVNFVGPLAEFKVYGTLEAGDLSTNVSALADAIRKGDVAAARIAYDTAHASYLHLAPVAEMFADLDTRIDGRADYYEKREQDPAFSGFRRIAYGLFTNNATTGLEPVVDALMRDVGTLSERLRSLQVPPERLAAGAARLMHRAADRLNTPATDSRADLTDVAGYADGTAKIAELLRPLLVKASAEQQKRVDDARDALLQRLDGMPRTEDAKLVLTETQRRELAKYVVAWAEALDGINPALGLQ
ncbi:MAG: iron uptake system protein EfeO [Rhodocyclaceae bacterium]